MDTVGPIEAEVLLERPEGVLVVQPELFVDNAVEALDVSGPPR